MVVTVLEYPGILKLPYNVLDGARFLTVLFVSRPTYRISSIKRPPSFKRPL